MAAVDVRRVRSGRTGDHGGPPRATDAGAAATVSFKVADATGFGPGPYDVVAFFDALHDLGDGLGTCGGPTRRLELLTGAGLVDARVAVDTGQNLVLTARVAD